MHQQLEIVYTQDIRKKVFKFVNKYQDKIQGFIGCYDGRRLKAILLKGYYSQVMESYLRLKNIKHM